MLDYKETTMTMTHYRTTPKRICMLRNGYVIISLSLNEIYTCLVLLE